MSKAKLIGLVAGLALGLTGAGLAADPARATDIVIHHYQPGNITLIGCTTGYDAAGWRTCTYWSTLYCHQYFWEYYHRSMPFFPSWRYIDRDCNGTHEWVRVTGI